MSNLDYAKVCDGYDLFTWPEFQALVAKLGLVPSDFTVNVGEVVVDGVKSLVRNVAFTRPEFRIVMDFQSDEVVIEPKPRRAWTLGAFDTAWSPELQALLKRMGVPFMETYIVKLGLTVKEGALPLVEMSMIPVDRTATKAISTANIGNQVFQTCVPTPVPLADESAEAEAR